MYCPKCGKEIPEGSRFCMHCGADLSGYKVEVSPKIDVSPKISVSAKAEYPRCPNCGNVLTDRNKLFSCQICGKKVCDTCGFHYNGLKLCERCKTKKEEEDRKEYLRQEEERKRRQREEERKREEEEERQGYLRCACVFLALSLLPISFLIKAILDKDLAQIGRALVVLLIIMGPGLICIYYSMKK